MTAPAETPPDARRRPRPRVAMSGQILHGIHHEVADVVVRNLTEGGAKVRLTAPNRMSIRGRLILRLPSGDQQATVAWQAGDEIGLRFD